MTRQALTRSLGVSLMLLLLATSGSSAQPQATLKISRASSITVRGQVQSMQQAFSQMAFGIVFAVLLVYFLMVVNFQSWPDPFIILMALPGALAGILSALFITRTTISVPASPRRTAF